MSTQGAVWSCNIYYKSWLAFLCTFSFSLPSNPPLTLLLSSRIWKGIIKPHSCSNSSCLQGGLGSSCQFLCCAGLLRALMCVPGSSPLSQLQHKVVCRLCKRVERSESGKKGTAWLIVWIVWGRATALHIVGLLPHFLFVVFLFHILGLPGFYLFISFHLLFHIFLCAFMYLHLFLYSFSRFPSLFSYLC